MITGRVDNGSDVRLLGQVCVDRRGTPGSLAGLHWWLAGPHVGYACWRGWAGWAGLAGPHGNGERGGEKEWLAFQLSFGPVPNRS
jgi:hypothetical protein